MKIKLLISVSLIVISQFAFAQGLSDSEFKRTLDSLSEGEKTEVLMGASSPVVLHNFKTNKPEKIKRIDYLTADDFEDYLPPLDEVKAMYRLYVSQGLKPYRAYVEAMTQLMIVISK